MQSVLKIPKPGSMKIDRHTGTNTIRLGSRVAEVAGDDRHGSLSRVVCIQVCG